MTPRIGLALIAKNEAGNLPHLLKSIEGAFDRVVLLDTGSKDDTLAMFREWADAERVRNPDFSWDVDNYLWRDDFAAARQAADDLLLRVTGSATLDWRAWADCDDIILGAQNLRPLAAATPPDADALMFTYDYAHDQGGRVICTLRRERLVRVGRGYWAGQVHEAIILDGPVVNIGPDQARWVHRRTDPPTGRNLRILRKWVRDEPENARVLQYLGTEHLARGRHKQAAGYFRRYLKLTGTWDQERAQVHRKLSLALLALDRQAEAQRVALDATAVLPDWPDSYLTLAQIAHDEGEWAKTISWCDRVLALGPPETMLIINPLEYHAVPRALKGSAIASSGGSLDDAIALGEEALQLLPDQAVAAAVSRWREERKRQSTTSAVLALHHLLVQHDEPEKALTLLERCVPHYVADAPAVVESLVTTRAILATEPAVEPVPDTELAWRAQNTPALNFVVEGLRDQAGEDPGFLRVQTRLGEFLTRSDDVMVTYLTMPEDGFERDVEAMLRACVRPGMVVADIGANIGYFARLLVELVGPEGEVHCVEPDPTNARFLRMNVPGAVVHEVAAMDVDGDVHLHLHPVNSGDNRVFDAPGTRGSVTVPGRRLESILPRLDFALVDTQGVDHLALEGLGDHRPPSAIVEWWPDGIRWSGNTEVGVRRAYRRMGYQMHAMGDTSEGHWNLFLSRSSMVPVATGIPMGTVA